MLITTRIELKDKTERFVKMPEDKNLIVCHSKLVIYGNKFIIRR